MNTVIFGPPGAGKGTQADNLVKNYNLFKVSAGDLLRKEINKKTKLGNEINSTIVINQSGYYYVEVVDINGCVITSEAFNVPSTSSIDDLGQFH